ncbi:MAG TPA: hypothetical protein VFX70_18875 [Mycobacteriales bacterium]|nr:hypothetical protein [Mycobacteriales bacterium]
MPRVPEHYVSAADPPGGYPPTHPDTFGRRLVLAAVLSVGVAGWLRLLSSPVFDRLAPPRGAEYLLLDSMLILPLAVAAVTVAARIATGFRPTHRALWFALCTAAGLTLLLVPLVPLRDAVLSIVQDGAEDSPSLASAPLPGLDGGHGWLGWLGSGLWYAVLSWPVVLVLALVTVAVSLAPPRGRRLCRLTGRAALIGLVTVVTVALTSGPGLAAPTAMTVKTGPDTRPSNPAGTGGCASPTVPKRTYDVVALHIDIPLNRFGDHDPYGYMYTLAANEAAVRAFSAATTGPNPTEKVSIGLREDPIQPLVLRARLGECVVIHFTNKIDLSPHAGHDDPVGPIPAASIDVQGAAYQIADGGSAVGQNPTSRMTPAGGTNTYRFYLDPLSGEGGKVFHSGGDSRQYTARGLFGAIIAEPAGSEWLDPITGVDETNNPNWSNWSAMIRPGTGFSFREFTIMYHEVGDEDSSVNRPLSEGPGLQGFGRLVPMVDAKLPGQADLPEEEGEVDFDDADGSGTDAYRPDGRAINYRSEPFWRRLQQLGDIAFPGLPVDQLDPLIKDRLAVGYSSYTFGDPATPMPRSYLGEPTKTRLMHPGSEQLHVHHLHGGGDRWRENPNADDTDMAGGLEKDPIQEAKSIRVDSQTVGPDESYNLEHECGAGGCQQAAGDYLFHCHIPEHYIAGMWSFWRVYDTEQPDLAALPDRDAPPAAVTSDQLVGRTFDDRTIVLSDPGPGQVTLDDWIRGQLPPQGVPIDRDDSTVWNWAVGGTPTAPVYLGEPESTLSWVDYTAPHPGVRDPIMFDPVNGRYAWPLMRPHLGQRPPFSPNGHGGAPWLGSTASPTRPDGLCPASAPLRTYNITAINVGLAETDDETDRHGRIYVLNEDKDATLTNSTKAEPLVIRSNVGDCVAITLSNEMHDTQSIPLKGGGTLTLLAQYKVNMHTHFVQFDPQASDGVITGMSFEQSVGYDRGPGNTTLTADVPAGTTTVPVAGTDRLRPGISVAVGEGRADIEIRTVTAMTDNTLTLDAPLGRAHVAGEPTGVEFVQYRWYSDVDSGTVFWHDHVDAISSWAHGLFGAHIIEPRGSTYHDPVTGAQIRSGAIADIHTSGSVGVGEKGSFREFMLFLSNGRRGRPEVSQEPLQLGMDLNFGSECEEGNINLRAEPIGERLPRADQHDEWNGGLCRNDYEDDATGDLISTPATIQTADPYVFSSVKYGDPRTPLLRAYVGDPVVIRTLGTAERVEALRIQGHRFRRERFNVDGELMDTMTTGASERFDYILDGGAGGPRGMPGDYLYYSTRNFAFESGAWGIFRVHDTLQPTLKPLPDRTPPPSGGGFPSLTRTGQDPPTPDPAAARNPCPRSSPSRSYDVSIFDATLDSAPTSTNQLPFPEDDPDGIVYALSSDVAAIKSGTKRLEPLVLRANVGDCVHVTLHNQVAPVTAFGGTRAGFSLAKLLSDPQSSGGSAIGFNPDTTVGFGQQRTYTFYADRDLGTSIFQNLGSEESLLHGAYGLFVTEPKGSIWLDNETGAFLGPNATSTAAAIIVPFGRSFREYAVTMETTDQHIGRGIIPYYEQVAGTTDDEDKPEGPETDEPEVPLPPGFPDDLQPGFNEINYHSAPTVQRIGPPRFGGDTTEDLGLALNNLHGVPETPLFRSYPGDPVVFRVGIGASNQFHTFNIQGHEFPLEPYMWDDATDHRSQLLTARALTSGETLSAELVGGAGGPLHAVGDFRYGDGRGPFLEAGLWGIFRVLPTPGTASPAGGDPTGAPLAPLS